MRWLAGVLHSGAGVCLPEQPKKRSRLLPVPIRQIARYTRSRRRYRQAAACVPQRCARPDARRGSRPRAAIAETPRICYDTREGRGFFIHTAIIGGGAAGVAAAIAAAERGQRVTVLERGAKPLKKLGVTGNGRANLFNSGAPLYYGNEAFALAVLRQLPYPALAAFFGGIGVPLREESEGRVYPAALMASVAVEALLLRARQLGVTFVTDTRVTAVERQNGGFRVRAVRTVADVEGAARASRQGAWGEGASPDTASVMQAVPAKRGGNKPQAMREEPFLLPCDRAIVTVGGAAAPAHGTDGTAYGLLTAFGHRLTALSPALCALTTDKRRIAGLSGQRVRAVLRLLSKAGRVLHAAQGEALFGEDAVSGIATMQLARFYEAGAVLCLDLRDAAGWEDAPETDGARSDTASKAGDADAPVASVAAHIRALVAMRAACPLAELLTGVFTAPVARLLCREAGFADLSLPVGRLRDADVHRLAAAVCDLRLPVHGTRGFTQAQVTAGGIMADDFDPTTMESRLQPGLYAAGEVLDVDGDCGGFNLMFAFASGILAGRAGGGAISKA